MFITKSKKTPFYQLTYEVNGKRTTISTKTKSLNEAYLFMVNFSGGNGSTQRAKLEPDLYNKSCLLSEFKDEYLRYANPTKSKKYIESISFSFKQFITFCGDSPLTEIDIRIVDKFINFTFKRTQRGAHHYYRTLKASLNKAVEWNYISVNPFTKVKFPKLSKTFPVFISEDELLIILANTQYEHLKDIFITAFYTGLRLGELINMRWNWINFLQNQITVKCTDGYLTKNKKERIVPMSARVRGIISKRFNNAEHKPDEVVFYSQKGRRLYQDTISKQFKRIVRKANLNDKIHFHTLRHSFASLLVQKGVSLYVVKELLGHEDLATTQIYSHLQQQNLRDAVDMI